MKNDGKGFILADLFIFSIPDVLERRALFSTALPDPATFHGLTCAQQVNYALILLV